MSYGNYIWHAFSWELLDKNDYLSGDAAKEAYNSIDKSIAICIRWFEDDQTENITCNLHTAEALDDLTEVYVTSSDFSWTYIKTHLRTILYETIKHFFFLFLLFAHIAKVPFVRRTKGTFNGITYGIIPARH